MSRLPGVVSLVVLLNASLQNFRSLTSGTVSEIITLTVPEVVETKDQVTSSLPFLFKPKKHLTSNHRRFIAFLSSLVNVASFDLYTQYKKLSAILKMFLQESSLRIELTGLIVVDTEVWGHHFINNICRHWELARMCHCSGNQ